MRSDKSYEKSAYGKLDNNYQFIVVAPNIKNVMLNTITYFCKDMKEILFFKIFPEKHSVF